MNEKLVNMKPSAQVLYMLEQPWFMDAYEHLQHASSILQQNGVPDCTINVSGGKFVFGDGRRIVTVAIRRTTGDV